MRFGCKRCYINQKCDLSEDLAVSTSGTCFPHLYLIKTPLIDSFGSEFDPTSGIRASGGGVLQRFAGFHHKFLLLHLLSSLERDFTVGIRSKFHRL